MNRILLALLVFALAGSLAAEEGFSSLEEQMSGKEFSAAGLNKLTKDELDVLNDWIRRHSLATLDAPTTEAVSTGAAADSKDMRGFKSEDDRSTVTSRIVGSFKGWDGQTVFELENGMIWAQSDKDKFYPGKELTNPVAVIEPGMFGVWRLHIEGYDSKCRVKRIQ